MNYVTIVKRLLRGNQPTLARRYLDIRRRQRIVGRALRWAMREAQADNPLASIDFATPLSVAGAESAVLARAEYMLKHGIPIALSLDAEGRHRGMPIGDAMDKLAGVLDRPITAMEVMDFYEQWCRPALDLLAMGRTRIARLPAYANRLAILRRYLEDRMTCKPPRHRFAAVVSKETVEEVLARIPKTMDKMGLLVSFSKNAGMLIEGHAVRTGWGTGCGLAVICRVDLAALLASAEAALTIECFDDHWVGWADSGPSGAPEGYHSRWLKFGYYRAPSP